MKIREIRAAGPARDDAEGGWSNEIRPDDCVHTLIAVLTDEGLIGFGSVFTNDGLVKAALAVLEPLYRRRKRAGAGAGQREAAPEHVLAGARRLDHAHHQRHRHRAVGHPGQGDRPAGGAAAGRALSRAGAALRLAPDGGAGAAGRASAGDQGAGLPGVQDRLGAVRPRERRAGRGDRGRGARCGRRRVQLMVDAGGSDAFWPQGLQVGAAHRRDAGRLRRVLVRGAAQARRAGGLRGAAAGRAAAHLRRRSADPAAGVPAVAGGRRVRHRAAGRDQGRRHQRGAAHRLDGAGARRALHPARLEHGRGRGRRSATGLRLPRHRPGRIPHRLAVRRRDRGAALEAGCRGHAADPRRAGPGAGARPGEGCEVHGRGGLASSAKRQTWKRVQLRITMHHASRITHHASRSQSICIEFIASESCGSQYSYSPGDAPCATT